MAKKTTRTRINGANDADKANVALARKANAAEPVQVTQPADGGPETKRSTSAKSAATEKMFKDADEAVLRGLPQDLTREQHENIVRTSALGSGLGPNR